LFIDQLTLPIIDCLLDGESQVWLTVFLPTQQATTDDVAGYCAYEIEQGIKLNTLDPVK